MERKGWQFEKKIGLLSHKGRNQLRIIDKATIIVSSVPFNSQCVSNAGMLTICVHIATNDWNLSRIDIATTQHKKLIVTNIEFLLQMQ